MNTKGIIENALGKDNSYHWQLPDQNVADVLNGGPLGVAAEIAAIDSATPLALPPAIIVVVKTPTMYPKGDKFHEVLKTVMETRAKSVSGIDISYTLESTGQPFGNDGQEIKTPTKGKRGTVNPSFTFSEVTGNLIWNLFAKWCTDTNHPDSHSANLNLNLGTDPDVKTNFVSTSYSCSFVAIQPDQTGNPKNMIDAALYVNVFPQGSGEFGLKYDVGATEVKERNITFEGIIFHNDATRALGKSILSNLNYHTINFNKINSDITTDYAVDANLSTHGLQKEVGDSGLLNQA